MIILAALFCIFMAFTGQVVFAGIPSLNWACGALAGVVLVAIAVVDS